MAQHYSIIDFFRQMPNALLTKRFWLPSDLASRSDGHLRLAQREEPRRTITQLLRLAETTTFLKDAS
jgi:hypothetical protein